MFKYIYIYIILYFIFLVQCSFWLQLIIRMFCSMKGDDLAYLKKKAQGYKPKDKDSKNCRSCEVSNFEVCFTVSSKKDGESVAFDQWVSLPGEQKEPVFKFKDCSKGIITDVGIVTVLFWGRTFSVVNGVKVSSGWGQLFTLKLVKHSEMSMHELLKVFMNEWPGFMTKVVEDVSFAVRRSQFLFYDVLKKTCWDTKQPLVLLDHDVSILKTSMRQYVNWNRMEGKELRLPLLTVYVDESLKQFELTREKGAKRTTFERLRSAALAAFDLSSVLRHLVSLGEDINEQQCTCRYYDFYERCCSNDVHSRDYFACLEFNSASSSPVTLTVPPPVRARL